MVNPITVPNFHEDQPSSLETTLASSIAARNPVGAMAMLIPEQTRRGIAQDQYHDYLGGVNALQAQNMHISQQEAGLKAVEGLNAHPTPGALEALQTMYPGLIPPASQTGQWQQSISDAANATNVHNIGVGAGAANTGGVNLPSGMLPPGTTIGDPALVRAAGVNNIGRIGAAQIMSSNKPTGSVTTTSGTLVNPIVTRRNTYGNDQGAPHGVGNVVPHVRGPQGGNPLVGDIDTTDLDNPNAPVSAIPTTPAPATPTGPSRAQIDGALVKLRGIDPNKYNEVMKNAVNGVPRIGVAPNGKPGFVGDNGRVY